MEMGRSSRIGVQLILTDDGDSVRQVLLTGLAVAVLQGTLAA